MRRLAALFILGLLAVGFLIMGVAVVSAVREDVCDHVASVPYETGERPLCVIVERIEP